MTKSSLDLLRNVDVCLSVELGRTQMKLKDVLTLGADSVVQLNRLTDELLDVFVNGNPIAKGEIAVQDGRFALRIVELAGSDEVADGSQLEVTRGASVQSGKAAA